MLSYDPTMRPPLLIISDSELLLFIFIKKKKRRKRTRKCTGSVLKVFISDSKLLSKNSTVGALLMCFLPITPTEFA